MNDKAKPEDTISKIYELLAAKKAPDQIGKPIYAKDIEMAKMLGAKNMVQLIGKKIDDNDNKTKSIPLNFGSKASTGMLPDDVRMRLFFLKKAISDVEIQAQYKCNKKHVTVAEMKSTPLYKDTLEPMLRAFDVTDFSDWADTQAQARFFFEEYELPLLLADQFDQMPMDASFIRVPGALGKLMGQLEADNATFTPQFNTDANYIVEAKNNVVHTVITQDLMDDAAPSIIDKLRKEVLKGVGRSYERTLIDGDVTNPHQDADVAFGSTDFRTAWNGLRKLAIANEVTVGGGAIVYNHGGDTASKTLFATLLRMLKSQNSNKADLAWIFPNSISTDLVTGAIPELFTAFAFGGLASNVTGQVPPVFGVNGVESEWMREDLHESGVYTIADQTKTTMLLVQKSRFMNWTRQATRVWAAPSLPSSDQMLMSSKARHAWAGTPQSETERSVVMARNVETQG